MRASDDESSTMKRETSRSRSCASKWNCLRLKKWYYGPRADRLQTPGDVAQMLLEFAGGAGSAAGESRRSSAS